MRWFNYITRLAISIYIIILITGNWEKAHDLLKNNANMLDLNEELGTYGKKLENTGQIKEAEKLYLALDKADLAINMYKNFERYDEVGHIYTSGRPVVAIVFVDEIL